MSVKVLAANRSFKLKSFKLYRGKEIHKGKKSAQIPLIFLG